MEEIYTVAEVASILKINQEVIRRWLKAGKLIGVKIAGDEWRVKRSDLDIFLTPKE